MATTFTIISLGDVDFLGQILNGVAMFCGTGDFKQLCVCGFIIGLLFICFQCLFQGAQRINLQHTFVCFTCYMLFFGPSCTVVIEDAQGSAYTRVVDNVPIGVGVAGTAISGIGYGVTKMMEQAYGVNDRTENWSYAEPLKILADLRTAAFSDDIWPVVDAACGAGCDTRTAVLNYLSDCTAKGVQLGAITPTMLARADVSTEAIDNFQFKNEVYETYLPLYDAGTIVGENGFMNCKAGWAKVKSMALDKMAEQSVASQLNRMLNIKDVDANGVKTVATDWTKMNNALQALGLTATNAQAFTKAAVLDVILRQADSKFLNSQQDMVQATTVNTAMLQRDTQWASEQTMFLSVARAIMAFFEGFVYAITPIMGFLLMVGAFGLTLIGKYFMVIAWIQLWLPCMSICNLYTMTGARSSLVNANLGGASFYALNEVFNNVSHWVAVGGMLMGATPMLALFMISGSMYAFTTLASRLQGQDHFNEKNIVPDLQQVGAVQTTAPMSVNDRISGVLASGAKEILPSVQEMSTVQEGVARASREHIGASMNFASDFVKSGGLTANSATSKSILQNLGQSVGNIRTESGQTIRQIAEQTIGSHVKSEAELNQIMGQMAATVAGGWAAGGVQKDADGEANVKGGYVGKLLEKIGVKFDASTTGTATNTDSANAGETFSNTNSSSDGSTKADALTTAINRAVQTTLTETSSKTWSEAKNSTSNAALRDSYAKMESSAIDYEKAKSAADVFGINVSGRSYATIAESLRGTAQWDKLQKYSHSMSMTEKAAFAEDVQRFQRALGDGRNMLGELDKANVMAALHHMASKKDFNGLVRTMGESRTIPSMSSAKRDLASPEGFKTNASPENVDTMRDFAGAQIEERNGEIRNDGQELRGANFKKDQQIVEDKHEEQRPEIESKYAENKAGTTAEHQKTILETLGKDRDNTTMGLKFAGAYLSGELSETNAQKILSDINSNVKQPVLTESHDFIKQKITGLSVAQKNFLDKYYRFQRDDKLWRSKVNAKVGKMSEDHFAFIASVDGLRREIREHVFGGRSYKELNDQEKQQLETYTKGMAAELANLYSTEAQGQTQRILDFNRHFKVNEAPGQSIK